MVEVICRIPKGRVPFGHLIKEIRFLSLVSQAEIHAHSDKILSKAKLRRRKPCQLKAFS